MASANMKHNLILLLLLFFVLPTSYSQTNQACNSNDFQALQGFLAGLESGIAGWGANATLSSCCSLPGVSCDAKTTPRRVIGLDLNNRSLSGNLSEHSLSNLRRLRYLNLSSNSLQGSVPRKLVTLPDLELLDLSLNAFSGSVPFAHINLTSIRVFNVSYNTFSGPVDATGLCNSSVITSRLQALSLSMNTFTGQLPAGFGRCRALRHLSLDTNSFSGGLPDDLFHLSSTLNELYLQGNTLSGPLTAAAIGNLSALVHLDLSMNNFSGFIPDVFAGLTKLQTFSAESNSFRGSLPASLSRLANLRVLNLRNNSLGGAIDVVDFSGMAGLKTLDLGINSFDGSLPDSLSRCSELTTLNLARNNVSGEIPTGFRNLTMLTYLSLSKNSLSNLSSALGVLQHCPNLTYLVLTKNFYRGETMPSTDGITGFKKMEVLVVANCALSGSIPRWLTYSAGLIVLDMSWNFLEGTIPPWLGSFDSLYYLDISNNSLTGEIPQSLTQLKSLISLNASRRGGGAIQYFPLYSKRNVSLQGRQYNQISSFPPSLILSNNKLAGPVLPGFGNLKSLLVLDLHMNRISGSILEELSEMSSLENLDLSYNNLTGAIPPSLTKLNFLSIFNVAHNNLVGTIPMGGQFWTFSRPDFVGNPGLCGFQLSPCVSEAPLKPETSNRRSKGAAVGMAIGIGIGTTCLLTVVYLAVSRPQCRRLDDKAKVVADAEERFDYSGNGLVLLFQNKDHGGGLTIDDILRSTNNFDQASIVGCGGFGLVYKAALQDGRKVAIKRLSGDFCQMEREFQAEVETLSRAQHGNLVLLQGYCRAGNDRLLIYSYMENGSLDYWLHERAAEGEEAMLNWSRRLQIARGAARGLAYLHQSCQPNVIHRDIKSSNILLDENFEARLADFGLARLILPQNTHVTTDLVGTLGYIPPEYGQSSVATYRGDVYSFGVVLLELLTSRRPVDVCRPKGCRDLIRWVVEMKEEGREIEVFDPFVYDDDDEENGSQMKKVLEIACLCVDASPKLRPLTQQLVTWLDGLGSECY